jgi:FkbM family methyltransferase
LPVDVPTKTEIGSICDVQTVAAPAFERALMAYARTFPLRKGKLRIIDQLWRAAAGNQGTTRLAHLRYGGLKMTCDLTEMLQRQFYFFGTYFLEEHILKCWTNAARKAEVIFDVGANSGIYSLAALASQPNAVVHAFEPTQEIAAKLRQAGQLNRLAHLNVHEVAVTSYSGRAILRRYRGDSGTNEGMNYICRESGEPGAETVQTTCLDDFCRERRIANIDLIKIDVQGNEHCVLQGAEDLLRLGRLGTIFMELNWADKTDCSPAMESVRLLAQGGYRFSNPNDHNNWRDAGNWLQGVTDIIARRFEIDP